jgi:hypothetical protein
MTFILVLHMYGDLKHPMLGTKQLAVNKRMVS